MNVACPQCTSVFRVDPAKVPAGGVRARCSICGGVIPVPEPAVSAATPVGGMEAILTPAPGTPAMSTPATPSPATETPAAPAAAIPTPAQPAPAMPTPAEEAPPLPTAPAEAAAMPAPAGEPPSGWTPAVAAPTGEFAATAEHAAPAAAPAAEGSPEPVTASHFNPYLQRDPHQRAKRLARALASDIVTYYPDKHAEAVRDGTFKELFDEEIRKSYEDYVSQVGAELAESTTYFQDAMNEVLARGKRVF